jgi:hypothetical protein
VSLSEFSGVRKWKSRMSATQVLWGKLEGDAAQVAMSAHRPGLTEQERFILDQCCQKLTLAKECIDRTFKRPFSFWELVHEVDALLLLVLPVEMLATQSLAVQQRFEQKVTNPVLRELWLGTEQAPGPLREAVQLLRSQLKPTEDPGSPQGLTGERLARCRYILHGALSVMDAQRDKRFWQLSLNVSIQILSAILLLVLFGLALLAFDQTLLSDNLTKHQPDALVLFALCGMGGAVLSNMLSKERFVVSTGATVRYFFYYLFVKPLIGGFAALFLILLEQSGLLLSVVVTHGTTAPNPSQALVQIVVSSEAAAFFARAVLSVAVGFSADRMLSSMMDSVLGRLFRESERGAPPPAATPGDPPGFRRTPNSGRAAP